MKKIFTKVKNAVQVWWGEHKERIICATLKALKVGWHIIKSMSILIPFLGIVILPFLDRHFTKWTALVSWIVCGAIIVVFDLVQTSRIRSRVTYNEDIKNFGDLFDVLSCGGSAVLIPVFGTFLITRYFETNFNWWWGVALILLVTAFVGCLKMYQFVKVFTNYPNERMKQIRAALVKTSLFYIIVDVFYISAFNGWKIAFFIFGIIALSIQLANVSTAFLKQNLKLKLFLVHDFIVAILLTIYLIYSIPNTDLKEIVLAIVSAVYGGFLALVGVAWTIKEGQHREAESKRLEKMPYLKVEFGAWITSDKSGRDRLFDRLLVIEHSEPENCVAGGQSIHVTNIGLGMATNLLYDWKDNANRDHTSKSSRLLRCDDSFDENIIFNANRDEPGSRVVKKPLLFEFDDLLGNHYSQELMVTFEVHHSYITVLSIEMHAPEFHEEI